MQSPPLAADLMLTDVISASPDQPVLQAIEMLATMSGRGFDRAQLTSIRYRAPDFVDGRWINTQEPLELADFQGKVLVVHFWAFG